MEPRITFNPEDFAAACRKGLVKRLWFFGSVLRDDFRDDSDVDIIVESFESVGLFGLASLCIDLDAIFGRETHLQMFGGIPKDIRPSVLASALLAYDSASDPKVSPEMLASTKGDSQ